jgi:Uma2 family endonuclease
MTYTTVGDVLKRLADYPPERIRLHPIPGTATKKDVLEVERTEGKLCELIDGVLVEKAMGLNESFVASWLIQNLGNFVELHDLGLVAGPDGTVELFPGQVRIPDVAFYAWDKFPGRKRPKTPIPGLVPDLAVEVLSKTNTRREMFAKRKDYFFAGVRMVWIVDPKKHTIDTYTGVDAVDHLTAADTLTGGEVLPGFRVPVAQVFG